MLLYHDILLKHYLHAVGILGKLEDMDSGFDSLFVFEWRTHLFISKDHTRKIQVCFLVILYD